MIDVPRVDFASYCSSNKFFTEYFLSAIWHHFANDLFTYDVLKLVYFIIEWMRVCKLETNR